MSAPSAKPAHAGRRQQPNRRKVQQQHPFLRAWNKVHGFLGPALFVAVLAVIVLLIVSFVIVEVAERHTPGVKSHLSALKWVVLALLARPPFQLRSPAGRVVVYIMALVRPSTIALITAALTSHLFGVLVKRASGMGRARVKDHIVICGWSSKGAEIIKEIRGRGDEESQRPVVVVAKLATSPTKDELTTFIHGDPTEAVDLTRAGIERARTAIVLADNSLDGVDAEDVDSRTLLTVLAVEALNPNCYTCVEVVWSKNREHFGRTKADELVVSAHLTGALLAHSAVTHGLSKVVGDLLTFPGGDEFYWVPVPPAFEGATFQAALTTLKQDHNCLAVAMASDGHGYVTNPPADRILAKGDRLLLIAEGEPTFPDKNGALSLSAPAAAPVPAAAAPAPTAPPAPADLPGTR